MMNSVKRHVLVVEDDENVRESMGQLLEGEGYRVSLAENGQEALTRLRTESPPDAIALDLRMPVMDGWEFRARQVRDPSLRLVPVVAISADGSSEAAAISAQAYLQRPVEAKTFLDTIARVMDEAEASQRIVKQGWPAPWGQSRSNVEQEISNPLAFLLMNIRQVLDDVRPSLHALETPENLQGQSLSALEVSQLRVSLRKIASLLEDCQIAGERIRGTIGSLRRLAAADEPGS